MGALDIILLVCFIPAVVVGLKKGLISQLFALAALVIGAVLAVRYSPELATWLGPRLKSSEQVTKIASFALLFVGGTLLLKLIGWAVTKFFNLMSLGALNRILGLVFALAKTALLLGLAIYIIEGLNARWDIINQQTLNDSQVYVFLRDLALRIFPKLKDVCPELSL